MKCDICGQTVQEGLLKKPLGTYVKKDKKKYIICKNCQAQYKTHEELLSNIKE